MKECLKNYFRNIKIIIIFTLDELIQREEQLAKEKKNKFKK